MKGVITRTRQALVYADGRFVGTVRRTATHRWKGQTRGADLPTVRYKRDAIRQVVEMYRTGGNQ